MNFVHSFWVNPMKGKKFGQIQETLKIILVNYAYSVACIHKFGHTITLYTDKEGYDILKVIPYDKIEIVENTITQSKHFAASIKFIALQKMSLDDILIDGDIFFEKPKVFDVIKNNKADLLVTLFEPNEFIINNGNKVAEMFNSLHIDNDEFYKRPPYKKMPGWYNTSVMKFNNEEFKRKHIEQYIYHVEQVGDKDFPGTLWPDIIFEQYNLTPLSKYYNWTIDVINPYYGKTEQWCWDIGFVHLGAVKLGVHEEYLRRLETLDNALFKTLERHYKSLLKKYETFK
jgi:hypothetical protein